MNRIAAPWLDRIAAEYGRGRPLALLFDYDGTVTPIVRHPSLARLSPRTKKQLGRLASLPDVGVGVISGRTLSDLRSIVGLEGMYYAGSGGMDIDRLGNRIRYPATEPFGHLLDVIHDRFLQLLRKFPGTWVERKPSAMAVHFRGLLPLAAACFRYEATALLSEVKELRFRVVSEAIEVTPTDGWDKGTAVVSILSHMTGSVGLPPFAVYFGDEANDLEGMAVANRTGGLSVGIGPEAPAIVEYQLPDSASLVDCLDELLEVLSGRCEISSETPVRRVESPRVVVSLGAGVLILDREDATRGGLASGLTELGWQVWQADTIRAAREVLAENGGAIDIALIDLQMPGIQGADLLVEIGHAHPSIIRCYLAEGIDQYVATAFGRVSEVPLLIKPLRAQESDTILRELLRRSADNESNAFDDATMYSNASHTQ